METYCRVTKESVGGKAGSLLVLRQWQRELVNAIYTLRPDGTLQYRRGIIGVARKNTKSTLGAGLALATLVLGAPGTEVYSCAGDKDQARIVFNTAKAMIEIDPELKQMIHPYKDTLEVIQTGSIYRALSAEAYLKEGLNPNLVIFDEVHVQPNDELWNTMSLAMGSRIEPLMLGITTAGVRADRFGMDTLCYRMYKNGVRIAKGEVEDPFFFFAWWEPLLGAEADHRDPKVWAEANPGLGDLVAIEDFQAALLQTQESEFRTKRTNIFVAGSTAWLPYGAWAECETADDLHEGDPVVLGFDGSYNNDSTAIVAARIGVRPFVKTIKVWEKKDSDDQDWKVPIEEVEAWIISTCQRYKVRSIVADPARWEKSLQMLHDRGFPIFEFPQSPERMIPATQRFYEAVINKLITHGSDEVLMRHLNNCVPKLTERGVRIVKQQKGSEAKIDAAVALIMAYNEAAGPQGAAVGWLTYMRRAVTNQSSEVASTVPTPTSPVLDPTKILTGGRTARPTLRCEHRWHPLDGVCVLCGTCKTHDFRGTDTCVRCSMKKELV
jgi:phage terminase large subunit-like protein